MKTKTKTFYEEHSYDYTQDPPGWTCTGQSPSIDDQVAEWLQASGAQLVSTSAPGFHHYWVDKEMRRKSILVGVVVIYLVPKDGSCEHPSDPEYVSECLEPGEPFPGSPDTSGT